MFPDAAAFREGVAEVVPLLREAVASQEWERVRGLAHRLEGSAGLFGERSVRLAAAVFQRDLGVAKAGGSIKGDGKLAESARELVRVCQRALGVQASRPED